MGQPRCWPIAMSALTARTRMLGADRPVRLPHSYPSSIFIRSLPACRVRAHLRRIRKTYLTDIHKKLAEDHKTLFLRSLISVQPLRHVAPPLLERDYVETARKISIVIVDDDSVMRKALPTLL